MNEKVFAPKCERGSDLIAFLYGEVSDTEALDVESHIQSCESCKAELVSFGSLRESVVAWKQEALGATSFPVSERVVVPATISRFARQPPSALTAIREFFVLSPLWLKGAVVFGSLLFCLFAVLSVSSLRKKPGASSAVVPASRLYTDEELRARVEKLAQERLQELRAADEQHSNGNVALTLDNVAPDKRPRQRQAPERHVSTAIVSDGSFQKRRPLSRAEREQLAADLRLVLPSEDADLDLVGDRFNRQN